MLTVNKQVEWWKFKMTSKAASLRVARIIKIQQKRFTFFLLIKCWRHRKSFVDCSWSFITLNSVCSVDSILFIRKLSWKLVSKLVSISLTIYKLIHWPGNMSLVDCDEWPLAADCRWSITPSHVLIDFHKIIDHIFIFHAEYRIIAELSSQIKLWNTGTAGRTGCRIFVFLTILIPQRNTPTFAVKVISQCFI